MAETTASAKGSPTTIQREQRFEHRMSDFEALMWNVEKDPWLNPSGGSLNVMEESFDHDDFRRRIAWSVAEVPRLRERVVPTLGRFSPPVWRPDPEFDLSFHIREMALPAPGTERQLLDLVAALYQDPYDRSRPLWQFFIIDGLEGGRSALFWKAHHTITDGIGMGLLGEYHVQRIPDPEPPPEVELDAIVAAAVDADREGERERPSLPGAVLGTAGHLARRQAGIARRMAGEMALWGTDPYRVRDFAGNVGHTVQQVRTQLFGTGGDGPRGGSPLWRDRSRHRHLEVLAVPLEPVKAAAKALGGTVNDVFVTGAVNGSLAYHHRRGAEVDALNLSFVVNTRETDDLSIGGNSFAPTRLQVPGGPMEPAERFALVRELMAAKRAEARGGGGVLAGVAGVANVLPTSLVTRLARSQAVKQDFATSNLRGPRKPRWISGAKVEAIWPFGPLAGTAFNLTTMSYQANLGMGLFVDPAAVHEPADLRDSLVEAYHELISAGGVVV